MNNFDDFLRSIPPEEQSRITELAQSQLSGAGDYSEKEMQLAVAIAQSSSVFMREMLRLYHEWLTKQMPKT